MELRNTIFLLFFFLSLGSQAQSISFESSRGVGLRYANETIPFDNNQSYGLNYISSKNIILGAEFRTIDWGNQLGFVLGYRYDSHQMEKAAWHHDFYILNNIALFRPSPKYAFGIGWESSWSYQFTKKNHLELGFGLRMDRLFGYEFTNTHTIELPIRIGVRRDLFSRDE